MRHVRIGGRAVEGQGRLRRSQTQQGRPRPDGRQCGLGRRGLQTCFGALGRRRGWNVRTWPPGHGGCRDGHTPGARHVHRRPGTAKRFCGTSDAHLRARGGRAARGQRIPGDRAGNGARGRIRQRGTFRLRRPCGWRHGNCRRPEREHARSHRRCGTEGATGWAGLRDRACLPRRRSAGCPLRHARGATRHVGIVQTRVRGACARRSLRGRSGRTARPRSAGGAIGRVEPLCNLGGRRAFQKRDPVADLHAAAAASRAAPAARDAFAGPIGARANTSRQTRAAATSPACIRNSAR